LVISIQIFLHQWTLSWNYKYWRTRPNTKNLGED